MVTRAVKPSEGAVLALHMGHDASMAVSYRGRVQCVLELERLFGQRSLGGRKGLFVGVYFLGPTSPTCLLKLSRQAVTQLRDEVSY